MTLDLIARLEAAAAGSDELDALVIASLVDGTAAESPFNGRWCVYVGADRHGQPRLWQPIDDHECDLRRAHVEERGPTRSLDAAVTLAPPGANCHGYELSPKEVEAYVQRNNVKEGHWAFWGRHPTSPAIAMCIAMLKAREASPKEP